MNYYLIDYENVKTDGLKILTDANEGDALVVFYSENCKNIGIDVMEMIAQKKLQFRSYKVKTGTKNALDFQLASHLGYLIGSSQKKANYYIVSNDKGYDCLCDHWRELNISVERLSEQKAAEGKVTTKSEKEKEKKTKSKVNAENIATLEEIKKYLSDEDMPDEVLEIFNQYKSKQAICNGISKKCKDSKRTSAIYKKLKPLMSEKKKS